MERRLAVRQEHIALGERLRSSGNMWYGAALLDESGAMNGSMLVMDFPTRAELQAWLDIEPYVTGRVGKTVEVRRCNVRDPWQYNRPQPGASRRRLMRV
jgi:uncharacterized protein YciI